MSRAAARVKLRSLATAKKASRSIKEKRADKHAKAEAKNHLDIGEIRKK